MDDTCRNINYNNIFTNINNIYNKIKSNQVILENKNDDDYNLILDCNKTLIIENCENINLTFI